MGLLLFYGDLSPLALGHPLLIVGVSHAWSAILNSSTVRMVRPYKKLLLEGANEFLRDTVASTSPRLE